jgi:hypothetical protein
MIVNNTEGSRINLPRSRQPSLARPLHSRIDDESCIGSGAELFTGPKTPFDRHILASIRLTA